VRGQTGLEALRKNNTQGGKKEIEKKNKEVTRRNTDGVRVEIQGGISARTRGCTNEHRKRRGEKDAGREERNDHWRR